MLSLGNPTQVHFKTLCQNLHLLHPKPQFLFPTHLTFLASPAKFRYGFRLEASKTQKNKNLTSPEIDDDDDFEFDEFLDLDDDDELEEDGDDDDEIDIPLKNMKKWFQNRPSGFGEGKVYDTSVEDKLMEEIEKSRIAQLANVNNLKNNPIKPGSNKPTKAPVVVQEGVQVRLVNLPKKKNIHRDLRLAFQGVPGLLNIVPVVTGNEKTRDPICKGLAFVYFKYEDEAHRFVQNFSGQMISFGKLQKKLQCEMVDPSLSKPQADPSTFVVRNNTPRLPVKRPDEHLDISLLNFKDTSSLREHQDAEEKHFSAQSGDETISMEISSTTETIFISNEVETREESTANSSPLNKEERKAKPKKKVAAPSNGKANSTQKLGSANRLKVRDKAMLTDVFSKYASKPNATSTVKQPSR